MSANREVSKVKYNGSKVWINWTEINEDKRSDHKDTFTDPPKAALCESLDALAPHVYRIHEEPQGRINKLCDATTITELTIKRNGEGDLVGEIKGYRELMKNERRAPLHMKKVAESEEDGTSYGEALAEVCDQALLYLDGNRDAAPETGNLFEQDEEKSDGEN